MVKVEINRVDLHCIGAHNLSDQPAIAQNLALLSLADKGYRSFTGKIIGPYFDPCFDSFIFKLYPSRRDIIFKRFVID